MEIQGNSQGKAPRAKARDSIRSKLFFSSAALIAFALAMVFSSVMVLDLKKTRRHLAAVEGDIRSSIVAKGKRMVMTSGITLRSLAAENSISGIREIVDNIASSDSEVVYGIFMDVERRPWAYRDLHDSARNVDMLIPLQDEMSIWSSGIEGVQYRSWTRGVIEIVEFAAPVEYEGERLGVVRLGLTTLAMNKALQAAKASSRAAQKHTLLIFLLIGLFAFLLALLASTFQAQRITQPIVSLEAHASRMARGDYGSKVVAAGGDEIALLARAFEAMRLKIRDYMENLQRLVEDKVQQIRDILDNVEQGLFTFNPDLTLNADHSRRASEILQKEALGESTLAEALRLSPREEELFRDWMEVVRNDYARLRWTKLSRLAPKREIQIGTGDGKRYVKLEYQKILDRQGDLAKIMVLAQDVTETRIIEKRLKEEKIRHENRVKIVLGIASNSQESILAFIRDAFVRLEGVQARLEEEEKSSPRGGGTDRNSGSWILPAFIDCHTIKGNAGAFGFEALTQEAQVFEDFLQAAHVTPGGTQTRLLEAKGFVEAMLAETRKIHEIYLLLAGNSEEVYVKLAERKVVKVRELAEKAQDQALTPEMLTLVEYCKRISFRSLHLIARKYEELVNRAAHKLDKDAALTVSPRDMEIDPAILLRVDESLVHLLRNAVAHGIEERAVRQRLNKGPGRIVLAYVRNYGNHVFTVRDDGRGIDGSALAARAVASGILSPESAAAMKEEEKLALVFHPGLSTKEAADTLSGRGLGLSIAAESARAAGGRLSLETWPGSGTLFTLTLPV